MTYFCSGSAPLAGAGSRFFALWFYRQQGQSSQCYQCCPPFRVASRPPDFLRPNLGASACRIGSLPSRRDFDNQCQTGANPHHWQLQAGRYRRSHPYLSRYCRGKSADTFAVFDGVEVLEPSYTFEKLGVATSKNTKGTTNAKDRLHFT